MNEPQQEEGLRLELDPKYQLQKLSSRCLSLSGAVADLQAKCDELEMANAALVAKVKELTQPQEAP